MKTRDHILLVDDDDVDAMTVRRALTVLGAVNPLARVADGVEALEFLRDPAQARPGLILLDLNMPRMNGLELLAELKRDARLRTIPAVVLTTSNDEADRAGSFGQSVAGYIVKPVDYEQFVGIMRVVRDYWITCEASA